jgi:hypothetical protein
MQKGSRVSFRITHSNNKSEILEGTVKRVTPAGKLCIYLKAEPEDPYIIYPAQVIKCLSK